MQKKASIVPHLLVSAVSIIGILLSFLSMRNEKDQIVFTPPQLREKEADTRKVPEEWIERIHKSAPGDDWRVIEANSIKELIQKRRNSSKSTILGSWMERGPSNIPGRITDIDIDYENGFIYAISDHGIIFQSSDLNGHNWQALNDKHPLGLGVASQLLVFPGSPHKIVSSGYIKVDEDWGIYFSGDNGLTWEPSVGIGEYPIMGIRRMMKQGDTVYAFVQEYNPAIPTDYYSIYKSINMGEGFELLYRSRIPIGDGGRHIKSDMWISNDFSNPDLYLALEDSLILVNKTSGVRTFNGLITGKTLNQCLLTGLTKNGITRLTAFIADNDTGKFYDKSFLSQDWQFKGLLTDWWLSMPFGSNSLSCSQFSGDTLYFGSILTSRSTDRGATWETIDLDSTGSYALYHGDVPKTLNIINTITGEGETYMGTDGGIYKLDREADHFNTISIPGLNCTQIYKMVSVQSHSEKMFIGTQDNGYCYRVSDNGQSNEVEFTFLWGGDVTNVASGDGGETFWLWWLGDGCNYMTGPDQNSVSSTWSPYSQNGSVPYWEPPVWISNHFPDRCYTAGYLNNSGGSHIIKIKSVQGTAAEGTQLPYDFIAGAGGKISAIAISPLDSNYFYAATENGYFCNSTNGGITWQKELLSPYMYPRVIYPSKVTLGKVWVGGSGYSNSPVFYSLNNGDTFSAFNFGMPSCLVEALAMNEDESLIFAATSIGPFLYQTFSLGWVDLADSQAPLVHYMDVEYLDQVQTARFATYARGIWDFNFNVTDIREPVISEFTYSIYPNPFNPETNIRFSLPRATQVNVQIFNSIGERIADLVSGNLQEGTHNYKWNGTGFASGIYFIRLQADSFIETKKVILLK